jgi:hypothetical protein
VLVKLIVDLGLFQLPLECVALGLDALNVLLVFPLLLGPALVGLAIRCFGTPSEVIGLASLLVRLGIGGGDIRNECPVLLL